MKGPEPRPPHPSAFLDRLVEGTTPRMILCGLGDGKMLQLVVAAPCSSLCLVQVSNSGRAEGTGSCLKTSLVAALPQVLGKRIRNKVWLKPLEKSCCEVASLESPWGWWWLVHPHNF